MKPAARWNSPSAPRHREAAARTLVVENPTLNVQSNVWEFWFPLDPNTLPDGPVEVRAKVIPLGAGMIVRELAPLTLYANGHGSLKFGEPVWVDGTQGDDAADGTQDRPVKTLAAAVKKAPDGGTIYLKAGKGYSAHALGGGLKRTYWTVIAAAPGVKRDDVEIGPGRPGTDKLCFRGVTLYSDPPSRAYNTILAGEQGKTVVWVDDCKLYNKQGRWGGGGVAFGNRYVPYVTGGLTTEMDNGPGGVLMRGHQIVKITSDAFTGVQTAINCSVEDIDPGQTGAHPDFHQSYVGDPNAFNTVILYNVWGKRCISQGFFGHNLRDSAFVNCLFHKGDTVMVSQYSGPLDHVLFLHLSLPNQSWLWRDGFQPTNCYMIDCLLTSLSVSPKAQSAGVTYEALHVTGAKSPIGQGGSVGAVKFVDAGKLDFRPAPDSAAAAGGTPLQCVPADLSGRPYDVKSPSRGCFQAAAPKRYPLTPHLAGPWWTIAGDPDLGALTAPSSSRSISLSGRRLTALGNCGPASAARRSPVRRGYSIGGRAPNSRIAIGRPRESRCRPTPLWAKHKAVCRRRTSSATTGSTGCSTATGRTSAWPPARTGRPSCATAIPQAGRSLTSPALLIVTATDATRWWCASETSGTATTRRIQATRVSTTPAHPTT